MQIKDVMSTSVVAVTPTTTLKDVAHTLLDRHVAGVPVVADGCVVGFVSESDVVAAEQAPYEVEPVGRLAHVFHRQAHEHLRPTVETAGDAMSSPAIVVEPWESVWCAASTMCERQVHQLPVVRDGRLVGIVARSDLVRAYDRPDEEIAREIVDVVLPGLGLSPTLVQVHCVHGHVTVRGWIEREEDACCLPCAVRRVPGVVSVDVRRESHPATLPAA
jgi:CBS domain-containing protein